MDRLKAIIIDDEDSARSSLMILLANCTNEIEVVAQANDTKSGIEQINKHLPDIVFLDVEMPGGSGFDILEQITNPGFSVVFTTAYNHYAIKAIRCSAFDYLLKPIDIHDLKQTIERLIVSKRNNNPSPSIPILLSNTNNGKKLNRLAIPTNKGLIFMEIETITRCEADANYTIIYTSNGEHIIVSKTLKEYEELLSDQGFFRIHSAHLINLKFVKSYTRGEGGTITMKDKSEIPVSRRKKDEFLELMTQKSN